MFERARPTEWWKTSQLKGVWFIREALSSHFDSEVSSCKHFSQPKRCTHVCPSWCQCGMWPPRSCEALSTEHNGSHFSFRWLLQLINYTDIWYTCNYVIELLLPSTRTPFLSASSQRSYRIPKNLHRQMLTCGWLTGWCHWTKILKSG